MLSGVLEFVEKPAKVLSQLKVHLNENGMMIGNIHDADSLEEAFGREKRIWYKPESIIEIANEAKCKIVDMSYNCLNGKVNQYIFSMKG